MKEKDIVQQQLQQLPELIVGSFNWHPALREFKAFGF